MGNEKQERCINVDWLEVYCLESNDRYPCNAEYFRRQGYQVRERAYGTRVWTEMFEILNENNDPIMEIRRNPASGDSSFVGLCPESVHLRLPNWFLYQNNPVVFMMEFILKHDYIFQSISRLDICLDFELFDTKDQPARFVRRYMKGEYRKINQCNLTAHGEDSWNSCNWNSLSWGNRTSMVSTKLYNKSKELQEADNDKPYIRNYWMMSGLVDNPLALTKLSADGSMRQVDVWRLEFSIKSSCKGWFVMEMERGKKSVKQHIPHKLSSYNSKDKLWARFQDLIYHYFHFKYKEHIMLTEKYHGGVLESVNSPDSLPLRRKNRCRDKKLFYFDSDHEFTKIKQAPSNGNRIKPDDVLERRLRMFRECHADKELRQACDILLKEIDLNRLVNYSPKQSWKEARALQLTLSRKMNGDPRHVAVILDEILEMINSDEMF